METQNLQYALISFDETNLLIPQHEVSVIETIDKLEINSVNSKNNAIAQFQNDSGEWPVFSLTTDFVKRNTVMASDRFYVCLQHPEFGQFGLICAAVSSFQFEADKFIQTPITEMMLLPINPISTLAYYQDYLYLLSNVEKLSHYLTEQ